MKLQIKTSFFALFATGFFLLSGCTQPSVSVTPTPAENDIAKTMSSVSTSAVKTAEAELTQAALAKPTHTLTPTAPLATSTVAQSATKTEIPFPTQPTGLSDMLTETYSSQAASTMNASFAFTNTPVPQTTTRPTAIPNSGSTSYQTWSCVFSPLSPSYGKVLRPVDDFDAHWIIQNTGTSSWDPEEVDIRYLNGAELHKKTDKILLTDKVNINNTIDVVVDMSAPKQNGTYSTVWGVVKNGAVLCAVQIQIQVEN